MVVVYVIRSREGHQYVGCTEDLDRRLWQHRNGLAGWTKRGTGWALVYTEEFSTLSEARRRERWLKTGVGREFLRDRISPGS
jgi:putative endonuclease